MGSTDRSSLSWPFWICFLGVGSFKLMLVERKVAGPVITRGKMSISLAPSWRRLDGIYHLNRWFLQTCIQKATEVFAVLV